MKSYWREVEGWMFICIICASVATLVFAFINSAPLALKLFLTLLIGGAVIMLIRDYKLWKELCRFKRWRWENDEGKTGP